MKIALGIEKYLVAAFAIFITFCTGGAVVAAISRAQVESELHAKLSIGDSANKIEGSLKAEKCLYSWDPHQNRYQGKFTPRFKGLMDRSVEIYVYVDKERRMVRIEVLNTYTFL
jgi:hypothetical protein